MEHLSEERTREVLDTINVVGLNYYPIKACGGTSLIKAEVGPRGFVHDREFMVVDKNGEFRTQRKDLNMALVRPTLREDTLYLDAPGMQKLGVEVLRDGETRKSIVWRDTTDSVDQGDEAAEWFSDFLKNDCRLVRMADDYVRQVDQEFARETDQVGFADGYPFLLTTKESLADLNNRIVTAHPEEAVIAMNRFRPNIVIEGTGEPFAEDNWKEIQIGGISFVLPKLCARCPVPTTNQETAKRGKEPMRTLLSFRPKNADGFPYFGQNLIHRNMGRINIGDQVTINYAQ